MKIQQAGDRKKQSQADAFPQRPRAGDGQCQTAQYISTSGTRIRGNEGHRTKADRSPANPLSRTARKTSTKSCPQTPHGPQYQNNIKLVPSSVFRNGDR